MTTQPTPNIMMRARLNVLRVMSRCYGTLCRVGVKILRISERNLELIPIFNVICY